MHAACMKHACCMHAQFRRDFHYSNSNNLERESVGQENATHVANQCLVTMQLHVNQKSENLGDNVCCAHLKEMTSHKCDTLVSAATKYSFFR